MSRETDRIRNEAARQEQIDRSVPLQTCKEKSARIDLGLALLEMVAKPGVGLTRDDIAFWCGCTNAGIYMLEKRAMKKVRNKLMFGRDRAAGREMVA